MDAVYIFGGTSPAKDDKIRLSVRSLDRHMADLRDVYVIGEPPCFLPQAKHIPYPDEYEERWKNAYQKTCVAAELPELSEDFLLMNDDFILQEPMTGADFPFYSLAKSEGGACGMYSYHMHCPMRLNKELYLKMPFDLEQKACMSPRTFYANFYRCPPEPTTDKVVSLFPQLGTFDEQAADRPWFSFSSITAANPDFMQWLTQKYPEPSRFE